MLRSVGSEIQTFSDTGYLDSLPPNNETLIMSWNRWATSVLSGRAECRDLALQRLCYCLEHSATELDLSGLNLTELPDYFPPSITALYVNRNQLTEFPKNLPETVKMLNLNGNQLTQLSHPLPPFLVKLKVQENQLTELPPVLPETLKILAISENNLLAFPTHLPAYLERLSINHNRYDIVPTNLPPNLIKLEMRGNRLERFPESLPVTLEELDLIENRLTSLPENLSPSLKRLYISYNRLRHLPSVLPETLKVLYVNSNQLRQLPVLLPGSLRELEISRNPLICLPAEFPPLLLELFISQEQLPLLPENLPQPLVIQNIDSFSLQAGTATNLPHDLSTSEEDISLNGSLTLKGRLEFWSDQFDISAWEKIESEENAQIFGEFLEILHFGKNIISGSLRDIVIGWINYLAKEENEALRKNTFLIAEEAAGNCVDRASFYFNKMNLLMIEHDLLKTSAPLGKIITTIVGMYRMELVERIAAEHVEKIKQTIPDFNEEIEIYFAYQYQLRKALSLPIPTKLFFGDIARLNRDILMRVRKRVLAQEKEEFLRYLVTESSLWIKVLEKWNKHRYDSVNEAYLEHLASPDFEEDIHRELNEYNLPIQDADARRQIMKKRADDLLFEKRVQLTDAFLREQNNMILLDRWR